MNDANVSYLEEATSSNIHNPCMPRSLTQLRAFRIGIASVYFLLIILASIDGALAAPDAEDGVDAFALGDWVAQVAKANQLLNQGNLLTHISILLFEQVNLTLLNFDS